ncbi:Phosphoglycolate phosphatase, HAD superfamily [Lentzea waywayandensis]|uniref:Phosphoglycolate phosphatase, HAD superfamily n=1 Tax=Lentzea waywayandensis TaxID=84724 RepID=A0A1I6DYS0_9PSEU|nr:HAD hydrolase-like protein [Lentzea waywayandensis]SFR10566.1 Phosphoglycolate phosphatase, HAD superfamily [Lentzea waywayandensis]
MISPNGPRVLVLWDIDHTLLQSRGMGREMYERAFPAAFGRPFQQLADVSGRTELDIIADTLKLHGIEPTEASTGKLVDALVDSYEAGRDEFASRARVLPGAREALAALATEPSVHQGVLTGNLRAVARIKLVALGLEQSLDLETSSYGDDHVDRAELVEIARERAGQQLDAQFDPEDTVLIGDTPRDVTAALTAGVKVIAVASGRSSIGDLREAGAHSVMRDLTNTALLRHLIVGE